IFGGVKRIVKVTLLVVPIMATFYLIIALYIVITNLSEIPAVFTLIVENAFGLREVVGGGFGAALMQGVRRDYSQTKLEWEVCQTQPLQLTYHTQQNKG